MPGRSGFVLPSSGILFLAVPDGAVAEMAMRIAAMRPFADLAVVHVSGGLGLDVLDSLPDNPRGSFHPLQPFPAPRDPSAFRGITIAVDATDASLRRRLAKLARQLGAQPRQVEDRQRATYHAAAVFSSAFVTVLIAEAVRLLKELGWSEKQSIDALMPLIEGSLANIRKRGPTGALTGPLRRGDTATVERHLAALGDPEQADLYRMLGLVALEIAQQAGLDPAAAERTKKVLSKWALTPKVAATRRRRSL